MLTIRGICFVFFGMDCLWRTILLRLLWLYITEHLNPMADLIAAQLISKGKCVCVFPVYLSRCQIILGPSQQYFNAEKLGEIP